MAVDGFDEWMMYVLIDGWMDERWGGGTEFMNS